VAVLGLASAFALLAAGGWLLARRARASRFGVSSRRRRQALGVAGGSAVGYLRKGDDQEETRHAEAIQRACAERGWAVARIVREASVNGTDAHSRPGLAFAFDELARRPGSRLVACRLDDVGRTRRELATVLEWCSRSRVHLLALDVGLDTGTPAGSLAARCLVAVGNGGCSRRRRAQRDGAKVGA
jgi:DNA invertase Pin-like site-specific DNA recombinase